MNRTDMNSNAQMLKIGEFAELGQVTVKTLHHYDTLGLLKPAHVDPFTNYRFYTVVQLARIHRIMALKEFGLSLDEIGLMLDETVSAEQIRDMLRLRQAEFRQQMREAQRRIALIEYRLHMIEAESAFPQLDVVIKRLEPLRVLSFFVPPAASPPEALQIRAKMASALRAAIASGLIQHTGITFDVYHGETILPLEAPEIQEGQHEILLGVAPTQEAVTLAGIGDWTIREEPAVPSAATLMLARDSSGLSGFEKVSLLRRWAIGHGYKPAGLVRYLHHRGRLQTVREDELVFEAQLPMVDAGVG
jgi:DNA-binding transcriptional MerR regulator